MSDAHSQSVLPKIKQRTVRIGLATYWWSAGILRWRWSDVYPWCRQRYVSSIQETQVVAWFSPDIAAARAHARVFDSFNKLNNYERSDDNGQRKTS